MPALSIYPLKAAPQRRLDCRTSAGSNSLAQFRPFWTLLLLICVLPVLHVRPTLAQDVANLETGTRYLAEGAFASFEQLLEASNDDRISTVALLLLRAEFFENRKDYKVAASDYERLLDIEPGHLAASIGLRRTQYTFWPSHDADLQLLKSRVNESPDNPSVRLQFAEALRSAEEWDKAVEQYGEYLNRTQAPPDVLSNLLATIASSGKQFSLGETIAEKYSSVYPGDARIVEQLAYFRLWQGKYEKARHAFRSAVDLGLPEDEARSGMNKVDSLEFSATFEEIRFRELVEAVEKAPEDDEKRFELVEALARDGHLFDASGHLEVIRNRNLDHEPVLDRVATQLHRIQTSDRLHPRSRLDRLYRKIVEDQTDHNRVFELAEQLIEKKRFFEAYDQLSTIQNDQGTTERWLKLFVAADSGLVRTNGISPVYAVDRLSHLVRAYPDDLTIRYELIDSFVDDERFIEALELLTAIPNVSSNDRGYQGRLKNIVSKRIAYAERRVTEITDSLRLSLADVDKDDLRELADHYLLLGDGANARKAFEHLISLNPDDLVQNVAWIEFLRVIGDFRTAKHYSELLLLEHGLNPDVQKQYILAHLAEGLGKNAKELLNQLLTDESQADPLQADARFLLDIVEYFVGSGDSVRARKLMERVEAFGDDQLNSRLGSLAHLLDRNQLRASKRHQGEWRKKAQQYYVAHNYEDAIAAFGEYFDAGGKKTRKVLTELAGVHLANDSLATALEILERIKKTLIPAELPDQEFAVDLNKQIAQIKTRTEDYSGALDVLEELKGYNLRDFETRFLKADVFRELGVFDRAHAIYNDSLSFASASALLNERRLAARSDLRFSLAETGQWLGYDFVGIIVPTANSVRARGGGTRYERWTQGLRAEVTLPIGAVATAGFNSHFITGTRRLVPDSEHVRGRINQIYGSVFVDLTPPIRSEKAPYTNRVFAEVGLYDYEGKRSVGYFNIRYWRQDPGSYIASIGLRTGEGSIELWSPSGGEFNLRLTQLDAKASSTALMPDSLLRIGGSIAVSVVSDNLGIPASDSDRNLGTDLMLEAGYKVVDHTYAGLAYHQLDYRSRTDTYYSPEHYESTEIFLEYEREIPTSWYLRLRGALGAISRSSGSILTRIEVDLIRRLTDNISVTISSHLGEASRSLGGGDTSLFNQYNTFHLTMAVYWTL